MRQTVSVAFGLALALPASAGTLTTLYTFGGGADGANPIAGLIAGAGGALYGTTSGGNGTVYSLTPSNGGWTFSTLYSFTGGADGSFPENLTADSSGALYGVADTGGLFNGTCLANGTDAGCGTVFKLTPPSGGSGPWTFSVLYTFTGGADGSSPAGGVVPDGAGGLLGFTAGRFTCAMGACGTVFRLTPPQGGQGPWTEQTIASFTGGTDGAFVGMFGPPVLGANGDILGVTGSGGNMTNPHCSMFGGCGLVFALHQQGGAWRKHDLHVFSGSDGDNPIGGLYQDGAGNLFGATNEGGRQTTCQPSGFPSGCGVIYALLPDGEGGWQFQLVHRFSNGRDGGYPYSAPIAAGAGALWQTASGDEVTDFGTIDKLVPPSGGAGAWHAHTAFTFTNDANSCNPTGSLVRVGGSLYGVTYGAGTGPAPYGTVFAFTP